ncbi:MAG: hypothetical protein FE834_02550 [Gammaproteobacteria bacterium]|nr:hypothetical protein [Gammaproteobacteria bacterium]
MSDHDTFSCSEQHEEDYVVRLYEETKVVRAFLRWACENKHINNSTHDEVYALIKSALGLDKK